MGRPFFWNELNTADFAQLPVDRTIAILPIASTEQHGPHLPISTDVTIANGMLAELRRQRPDDRDILRKPRAARGLGGGMQDIGVRNSAPSASDDDFPSLVSCDHRAPPSGHFAA